MGREAVAVAHWRGAFEEVKALLESQEIILRGAIKARLMRSGISNIAAEDTVLTLQSDGEPLILELGATEAAKWVGALLKLPPSITSKLGIGPGRPVYIIGENKNKELNDALEGVICKAPDEARVLMAIIEETVDLAYAFAVAKQHPKLFVWCVYRKGKDAKIGDTTVRAFMRPRGYKDNKSCSVSAKLTATRYGSTLRIA